MLFLYVTIGISNVMLFLASIWNIKDHFKYSDPGRNLRMFLMFLLAIEIISKLFIYLLYATDMKFLFNIFVAGELLLLTNFTNSLAPHKNQFSKLYLGIFLLLIAASVFNEFQPILWMKWIKPISNIIIVLELGRCLLFSLKAGYQNHSKKLFYVQFALFLYYFVSTILFLVLNQLQSLNIEYAGYLWSINNILSCSLYAVCLYYFYSTRKSI
ncbi:hypothetical protein [Sphingobacterium daejeonense]|uniref:hypothetical protein n=1 Tax=Sphingobacterium daejeonense TaxID=371142 RepID=UPI0010FD15D8|nr:hypothetical protein [Sphingobacterium daejeonense]